LKINEIKKYHYIGNCVNSFDENGYCTFPNFSDATEFAQAEEDAKEISQEQFNRAVEIPNSILNKIVDHQIIYLYAEPEDVYMAYDADDDIHYFFIR